ncbi:hypothetical protein A2U01_0086329, partial [Trifolium medium]|nr:hypothetical protein [Trifolium medium]
RGHSRHHRGHFARQILESTIPSAHEKPLKLESYDGTEDPDKHIEHINIFPDYHYARGEVKC